MDFRRWHPRRPHSWGLQYHLPNWKLVTRDQWIWNTIMRYKIVFTHTPTQIQAPPPIMMGSMETKLIQEELGNLIEKGAEVRLHLGTERGFILNLILVPKKGGGHRPVVNLKALNEYVQTEHFKMEGLHTVKQLARPGDWLAKVDLKDAYFSVPTYHKQMKLLCFRFQGTTYEFRCLPFGLHWSLPRP